MSSCFVGFNLSSGDTPSFGIWHENFFLSYRVLKSLQVSVFKNNPYWELEIEIDNTSTIKINRNDIKFNTSGGKMDQSHVKISDETYKKLKDSILKMIKDENMHGIEQTRMIWDELYKVKVYHLFVKKTRWGFKRQVLKDIPKY